MANKLVAGTVPEARAGMTVKQYLEGVLGLSRREISHAKFVEDGIRVNGRPARVNVLLRAGDRVEVLLESRIDPERKLLPVEGELDILYEDADLLVVNKPAGLTVHPAGRAAFGADSLANRLQAHLQIQGQQEPVRIVGRLDKDTSGLVLAAKSRAAAARLARQREEGRLSKTYLAITVGMPDPLQGTVDLPLMTDPEERTRMCVAPPGTGLEARTFYETIQTKDGLSLVRLTLATGRTHQIRVHMAALGCPLLGDPLYGCSDVRDYRDSRGVRNVRDDRGIREAGDPRDDREGREAGKAGEAGEAEEAEDARETMRKGFAHACLQAWQLSFLQPFTFREISIRAPISTNIQTIFDCSNSY